MNTGLAIKAAIERGREHQRRIIDGCDRKLYVRFMTQWGGTPEQRTGVTVDRYDSPGLLIRAAFASRNNVELAAQGTNCERMVPWDELDARAGALIGLVDECVAAAEAAVGLKAVA